MLQSEEFSKAISPSNTYVIPVYADSNYSAIKFKKFTVPEEYRNKATWYFYNRLDFLSCGGYAFPFEMYQNLEDITE